MVDSKSGIRLKIIEENKFNTVGIAVLIKRKLSREEATLNALLSIVLGMKSKKYKSIQEINIELDKMMSADLSIDIMKKGEFQLIEFYGEVVNKEKYINQIIDMISEIMLNPYTEFGAFSSKIVDTAKEKLKIRILSKKDNKKNYAKDRLVEEMFKNQAFGIDGDGYIDDLDEINARNLFKHYQKIIIESEIEIIVLGNVNKRKLKDKINDKFYIPNKNVIENNNSDFNDDFRKTRKIDERVGNLNQGKICVGIKMDANDDFYSVLLGSEIFGGGGNSLLFSKIREKESLCYYINAFVFRFNNCICVQSGVDEKDFNKVETMIKEELQKMQNGDYDESLIDSAKKSIEKSYLITQDYITSEMNFYLNNILLNQDYEIKDVIKKINKINKDDISECFKKAEIDTIFRLC